MSKEYGIEPESINTYETFFRIVPHFGAKHFRFIRKYPKNWSNRVKKALDNVSEITKARIVEKLIQIDKELIDCIKNYNGNPTYNGNLSWFDNAVSYHSIHPFDGIITNANSNHSYVCDITSFDVDTNPIFDVKESYKVRRSAEEMASAAKQLLQHAKEIHFVDPLLEKVNNRHVRPLLKFIETINERIGNMPISSVIYHIGNSIPNDVNIKKSMDFLILPKLPSGFTINFIRWSSDQMHNRFILTDIGGIFFGIGLDDDDFDPNQKKYDDISPLSYEVCLQKDCNGIKFMNNTQPVFYSITGL